MNKTDPSEAAVLMRNLSKTIRDKLITLGNNVFDLRPILDFKMRQRKLAKDMRKPKNPSGDDIA